MFLLDNVNLEHDKLSVIVSCYWHFFHVFSVEVAGEPLLRGMSTSFIP